MTFVLIAGFMSSINAQEDNREKKKVGGREDKKNTQPDNKEKRKKEMPKRKTNFLIRDISVLGDTIKTV